MRKILITITLAAAAILPESAMAFTGADHVENGAYVTTTNTKVRSKPTTASPEIKVEDAIGELYSPICFKNSGVKVVGESGEWVKIEVPTYEGEYGYIMKKFITRAQPLAEDWWKHTYCEEDKGAVLMIREEDGRLTEHGEPIEVIDNIVFAGTGTLSNTGNGPVFQTYFYLP